ncbi:MAG: penicillin-binding protein 1C [Rhizobiaceae bacterium]
MTRLRKSGLAAASLALAVGVGLFVLDHVDKAYPPPLPQALEISREMVDRDGALLRAFSTRDGFWRFQADKAAIDPDLVKMLVAYEDKRFFAHHGVDPLALGRAFLQFVRHGDIVSGGSTITMQVARLIEPREERSLSFKLRQMARAVQIERRLSKDEILTLYLTLAPYGGNIEGVRAASLAWFGKEPKKLTLSESALLVALPQSPETRRPDRKPKAARAARDRVLNRMADAGLIPASEIARASVIGIKPGRAALPTLAPHLADSAMLNHPEALRHQVTLKRSVQQGLEEVARDAARRLGPKLSVAILIADMRSGEILGEVGSPGYYDRERGGFIDMLRVPRSPGSTLKPLIYGLAFENGIIAQNTILEDRPSNFSGYRPRNFDSAYQGDVSARDALQMSLNVPAVKLLEAVGTPALFSRLRRAGAEPVLPKAETPGLATGLGGLGLSLKDLVQVFAAIGSQGNAVSLFDGVNGKRSEPVRDAVLSPQAAWQIIDILGSIPAPGGVASAPIAFKTGTSYGYRDAWSIGFDGRHVIGVWVGRPDNAAVPGITGGGTAAPILFDAYHRSGLAPSPLPKPPSGAVILARGDLPVSLQRFAPGGSKLVKIKRGEDAPEIVFPPNGARVELASTLSGEKLPLVLKINGGKAPYRWLANGEPLPEASRKRTRRWMPDGAGFSELTVIDANGKAATVKLFVE